MDGWMYVCVCVSVCMYVWTDRRMGMDGCIYVRVSVCMYVRMYGWMDVCVYVCMYVCMHVCMHVCDVM